MSIIKKIKSLDIEILENEPLTKYNTYHVGGECLGVAFPDSKEKLMSLLDILKQDSINFKILGRGSNIIFSSKFYDGIIIKLDNLKNVIYDETRVICDAGVPLISLSFDTANQGLAGLEFLSGIPGTIGGALYMNAGAYKEEMSDIVLNVTCLDENYDLITLEKDECLFGYRTSIFKNTNKYIILGCTLSLKKGNKETSLLLIEDRRKRRVESQPLEYPSAGSVFRNPDLAPAGKLIEDAGLKGKRIGGAEVSMKHANFIINVDNATGEDIKELIEYVQGEVKKKFDVDLILEQELFNF